MRAADFVRVGSTPNNKFFELARAQFERGQKAIGLDADVAAILEQPKNEIVAHFPVRLASGEVRIFEGYRVQHNNCLS